MPRFQGFIAPSYKTPQPLAADREMMNFYVARNRDQNAPSPYILCPSPGVNPFLTATRAPIRGQFAEQGRAYAVTGDRITEYFYDGTMTDRGAVAIDGNPATATTNGDGGDLVFFTSGNKGYSFNRTTNTLTEVLTGALMAAMFDTFLIVFDASSSTLKSSDSLGATFSGLAIAQRSTESDPWKSMVKAGSKLYMIGERTSDVYYDIGASPFPLAPIVGGTIPYGTGAPFSAIAFEGAAVWLSQSKDGDRQVVMTAGYGSANPISDPGMEWLIGQYETVSDCESMVYEEFGINHLVMNFPTAKATWAYTREGGWSQLGTWDAVNMRYDAWHARNHVFTFGKHYVGDRTTSQISQLGSQFGTDIGGGPLRRQRIPNTLESGLRRIGISNVVLDMRTGVGLTAGVQGDDPTIMLQKSKDGGRTWGPERWRSAGRQGDTMRRVKWQQLGSGRRVRFSFVMTDPVMWNIYDALVNDVSQG